jgi:hypothetical protein
MPDEGPLPPQLREAQRRLLSLRTALRADHSLVGACAVVTESRPTHSVVADVPTPIIGRVRASPDGTVSLEYDVR